LNRAKYQIRGLFYAVSFVFSCEAQRGAYEGHCPRMVAWRQQAHEEVCDRDFRTPKERQGCIRRMPEACAILEHPEVDEDGTKDEDSCFKYCRLAFRFSNDMRCSPHGQAVTQPNAKKKGN
jgi:hypothetical protein